jgi:hypothetical protein
VSELRCIEVIGLAPNPPLQSDGRSNLYAPSRGLNVLYGPFREATPATAGISGTSGL